MKTVREILDHKNKPVVAIEPLASTDRVEVGRHLLVEAFATDERLRAAANLVILTGSLDDPLRSDDGLSDGDEVLGGGVISKAVR